MKFSKKARLLIIKTLVLALPFCATSCFWGDEYDTRQVTGHYYLSKNEPSLDEWNLYFEEETTGLAGALFDRPIVEAGFNEKCIIMRVTGASPQFYIALITNAVDRAEAQANIRAPMTKDEFQNVMREINGDTLLKFNPDLTKSRW